VFLCDQNVCNECLKRTPYGYAAPRCCDMNPIKAVGLEIGHDMMTSLFYQVILRLRCRCCFSDIGQYRKPHPNHSINNSNNNNSSNNSNSSLKNNAWLVESRQ
jgi:hypothetical protein